MTTVATRNLAKLLSVSVHNAAVGHARHHEDHRGLHPLVTDKGFGAYAEAVIDPVLKAGCTRVMLYSPGGSGVTVPGDYFEFDALLEAERLRLIRIPDFVETFAPYHDRGVEIIAYLGCYRVNTRFRNASAGEWLDLLHRSVRPVLDAKCSLMVDSSSEYEADSLEFKAFAMLRSLLATYGGAIYAENAGAAAKKHFAEVGVWAQSDNLAMIPATRHGNEILCHMQPDPAKGQDWNAPSVKRWMPAALSWALSQGYTPMSHLQGLVS